MRKAMFTLESNFSFQENLVASLSVRVKVFWKILIPSGLIALALAGLFLYLFPKCYAQIDLTALEGENSQRTVVWLSLPDITQIKQLG